MSSSSAPGKVILFGEHAVVYGQPALAVPVTQVQATVDVSGSSAAGIHIDAPDIGLRAELNTLPEDHPIAALLHNLLFSLHVAPYPSLNIQISSTIPVASGLGSGAAVSVALARALAAHLGYQLDNDQVNAFAYEIEKLHHGTPSGIDNTVITYARPVYFIKAGPLETFRAGRAFTLVIGDTGIPAPTRESVGDVRALWQADPLKREETFAAIGRICEQARQLIENGEPEQLGTLMDQNHALLQELTVSSPELDRLVESSRAAGALGAKMSGGGRGGNMIALVRPGLAAQVTEALLAAGAKNTITTEVRP
jgi:mevalonate kinase